MGETLVSPREACRMCGGISESMRRRLPDFPAAVALGRDRTGKPTRIAFVRTEVEAWIAGKIARARTEAA